MITVTKTIELDYGHTLPEHFGFCNQIHGHRAKIEATFTGELKESGSQNGMIIDFKICKEIMMREVHDVLDHGFAVWIDDDEDLKFITQRNKKVLITSQPPTAEHLVRWAFNQIDYGLREVDSEVTLVKVRWYETPTSWADYERTE